MEPSSDFLVFIPALAPLLARAEQVKGSPLTEAEVLTIRDNANCLSMTSEQARQIEEDRGYADLDPENAWAEWQQLRAELADAEGTGGEEEEKD